MPIRTIPLVVVALALAACGSPQTDAGGSGTPETAAHERAEAIAFGEALAQIRGHHLVSLELYKDGDKKNAAVHAVHPIAEILDSIRSELDETDPEVAQALADALEAGAAAVTQGAPPSVVEDAYDNAASVTDRALASVMGAEADAASYVGSVIAALLATAAHEYEEAVGDGRIRLLAEYQDGYGFVKEAERSYGAIAGDVEAAAPEEAEEIEEAFSTLHAALPSPRPPGELAETLDVEAAAKLIGHELEETVDAEPVEESDPEAIAAEIEKLLDEIVETYEAGDADAAAELSAEAYLENYELIEAEVIEMAPEVNDELEPLLGADLRRRISDGAPVAEIKQMTRRAKELLAQALDALEGEK